MPEKDPGSVEAIATRFSDVAARSAASLVSSRVYKTDEGQRTPPSLEIRLDALHPPAEDALEERNLLLGILLLLCGRNVARVGLHGVLEAGEVRRVDRRERVQQGVRCLRERLRRARLRRRPSYGRHLPVQLHSSGVVLVDKRLAEVDLSR